VYYAPYKHNQVPLYDGAKWQIHTFTELSQALTDATKSPAAAGNDQIYDVFVWNDAGTLRATRGPVWSTPGIPADRGAAAALEFFEGRWVNKEAIANGPAARRGLYVGSIATDGAAKVNDVELPCKRHVWNTYNRVERHMAVKESAVSWNYTTATWRQANANAANQLDLVVGLSGDVVRVRALVGVSNPTPGTLVAVGVDLNGTSGNSATLYGTTVGAIEQQVAAEWASVPDIGRNVLAWVEYSAAAGTTTWYSSSTKGLVGSCWA
jgi:hypothetical protein